MSPPLTPDRPLILVTNDDGVQAPGLAALAQAMRPLGRVVIVAPDRDNSAVSHAITMNRPLVVRKVAADTWSVDGTPTDCVTLAISRILDERPRLVVSGINPGGNLGDDINYSGTVSAAMEATMQGVEAMAISLAGREEPFLFATAAEVATAIARRILACALPRDTLLNVNVPNLEKDALGGAVCTSQGRLSYQGSILTLADPWGRERFWIGGGQPVWEGGVNTDSHAIAAGAVSITPLHLDRTNHEAIGILQKSWRDLFDGG